MIRFSTVIPAFVLLVFGSNSSQFSASTFSAALADEVSQKISVWQEFSSKDGGFTVLLPAQPQENLVSLKTDLSQAAFHVFTVINGDKEYGVTYTDLPQPARAEKDTEKIFRAVRQLALTGRHRELLKEQFLTLNDHPGREFTISEEPGRIIIDRAYLAGKRVYQVIASFPAAKGETDETKRFFESFRLSETTSALAASDNKETEEKPKRPVSGTVRVLVTIDEKGNVISAKAVDGPVQLRKVAEESALKWKFKPTLRNGVPVQVEGYLTFNFTPQ